jgi:hypothetical protein
MYEVPFPEGSAAMRLPEERLFIKRNGNGVVNVLQAIRPDKLRRGNPAWRWRMRRYIIAAFNPPDFPWKTSPFAAHAPTT